jgi:hypothetical protein
VIAPVPRSPGPRRSRAWRAGLDPALALVVLGSAVAAALALPPRPFGDAAEYLLMAESWAGHGGPALRPSDVQALRSHAARAGVSVDPDDALGNYFEGRDGRFYSYHFWFYPLATMPARVALRVIGADELRAGPLTNAVLFGAAIGATLLLAPGSSLARRSAAALLASSPALGFVLWPHPEVMSFSLAALALVFGARGSSALAVACAAAASVQNPPLALLAVFEAARPWLAGTGAAWTRGRVALLAAAGLLAMASPLFFLARFSTPNLAAYETAGAHEVGVGKALGLLFDLDLGLVRHAPLTVALLVGVIAIVARGPARRLEGALVAVLALMMLASSATGNWNHGTTGPSRYVAWLFPLVAYLLVLGPTARRLLGQRGGIYRAAVLTAVAAQVAVAVARGGLVSPLDYLEHSALARNAFDRWPALYDPVEEVFRERTAHTEADLDEPYVYERDGECRKALARWKHAEALRARCGQLPESVRPFFESRPPKDEKARWVYVNY